MRGVLLVLGAGAGRRARAEAQNILRPGLAGDGERLGRNRVPAGRRRPQPVCTLNQNRPLHHRRVRARALWSPSSGTGH